MSVTAEAVEELRYVQALSAAGCDSAQGYLFSRPVAAPKTPDVLARFGSRWHDRDQSKSSIGARFVRALLPRRRNKRVDSGVRHVSSRSGIIAVSDTLSPAAPTHPFVSTIYQ